jgi:hypothetical protein
MQLFRVGTSGGFCEHGNETPGSINAWCLLVVAGMLFSQEGLCYV